jgi:Tol biopolymer transport system component
MFAKRNLTRCALLLATIVVAAGCSGEGFEGGWFIEIPPSDAGDTDVTENFPDDEAPDDDGDDFEYVPVSPLDAGVLVSVYLADNNHDGQDELYAGNFHGAFSSLSAPLDSDEDTHVTGYEYAETDPNDRVTYVVFTVTGSNQGVHTTPLDAADPTKISLDTEQDRPDGSGHQVLHDDGRVFTAGWTHDGSRILLTTDAASAGQYELTVMNPDGTGTTRISRTAAPAGTSRFVPFAASPTENRVLFRSDAVVPGQYELYVLDLDGTGPATLIEGATSTTSSLAADFTPDGENVLILRRDGSETDLLVAPKGGGPATNLTANIAGRVADYRVSPDSSSVAFRVAFDGVYAGDFASDPVRLLESTLVASYGFSPGGTQVFIVGTNGFQPPRQLWIARAGEANSARPASEPDEEVLAATFMDGQNVMALSDIADSGALQTEQEYGAGPDLVRVHRRTVDSSTLPLGVEVRNASVMWDPADVGDFAEVSAGELAGHGRTEIELDVAGELLTFQRYAAYVLPNNVTDPHPVVYAETDSWTGNDVERYTGRLSSSAYLQDADGNPVWRGDDGAECGSERCGPFRGKNFFALAPLFSNDQTNFRVTALLIAFDPVACLVYANQYRLTGVQPSEGPCTVPIRTQDTDSSDSGWEISLTVDETDSNVPIELDRTDYDEDEFWTVVADGVNGYNASPILERKTS